MSVSDGLHGLRKQSGEADHLGLNESIRAVCFPAGCAVAASFDRELAKTLGETLGEECQAEDISTILGPAMNIKRSPCADGILSIIPRIRFYLPSWAPLM